MLEQIIAELKAAAEKAHWRPDAVDAWRAESNLAGGVRDYTAWKLGAVDHHVVAALAIAESMAALGEQGVTT